MSASPARWNAQSTPWRCGRMAARSATSASTTLSSGEPSRWPRLVGRPVEKLSITVTCCPRSMSAVTRWLPMKPAPPVTRLRIAQTRGDDVAEHQVHVLDWSVGADWGCHEYHFLGQVAKVAAIKANQADGGGSARFGQLDGTEQVGRVAAGRNSHDNVAS